MNFFILIPGLYELIDNDRVVIIRTKTAVFKLKISNSIYYSYSAITSCICFHLQFFKRYLSLFQILLELFFFIDHFLHVWYQNEEGIHLIPVICLLFAYEIFQGNLTFISVRELFLLSI